MTGAPGGLGGGASAAAATAAAAAAPVRFPAARRPVDPLDRERRLGGSGAIQVVKAPSAGTTGVTVKVARGGSSK